MKSIMKRSRKSIGVSNIRLKSREVSISASNWSRSTFEIYLMFQPFTVSMSEDRPGFLFVTNFEARSTDTMPSSISDGAGS